MIDRILVVGAGQMGAGIAQVAATAGMQVTLVDVDQAFIERGIGRVRDSLARLSEKGTVSDLDGILRRIRTATELEAGRDAQLMIEAAPERFDLKADVFVRADRLLAPEAILASNTSSIPIGRLAATTHRADRVCGMHFFNPVPVLALVEVIRGLETSDETAAAVRATAEALGKTVAESRDVPGFIGNRILLPMLNEAAYTLYEGVGDAESIDTVMKLGMAHPMGPLALADLIGLDTCLSILEVLHAGFGDPKYRPCPIWRQYVDAGRLGRKSGRGFHVYASA